MGACGHNSSLQGGNILQGIQEDFVHITFSYELQMSVQKAMPRCMARQKEKIIIKYPAHTKKKIIILEERKNRS